MKKDRHFLNVPDEFAKSELRSVPDKELSKEVEKELAQDEPTQEEAQAALEKYATRNKS